jgi:cellobiose epimerase
MEEILTAKKPEIVDRLHTMLTKDLFEKFYPYILDKINGGFLCNLTYDWRFVPPQDKMIVTQARHVWTPSKAARFFPEDKRYVQAAKHGFEFLKNAMWDKEFGGFYTMRNVAGRLSEYRNFFEEKRTYGIAFAIYALAAYYELTKEKEALDLAIEGFEWIEKHAYDPIGGGYYQFLTRAGKPYGEEEIKASTAYDANEAYYKDQNSSIHLLEAYTELYNVWKNDLLKKRLNELLLLIRDTITTEKGYMNLFFDHKWKPISFRHATEEERSRNYGLDHVSFGHDFETAFLMLEASHALGLKDDKKTLNTAKKMMDHAIENGFDESVGGFYDGGYYYDESDECTIIFEGKKNWWAQAEGLNSLLLFSRIFPEDPKYFDYFLKELEYIDKYLLDHDFGGWFEGGTDKEPDLREGMKGHIWKACYHEGRSLMNCIRMLSDDSYFLAKKSEEYRKLKQETEEFIDNWKQTARSI